MPDIPLIESIIENLTDEELDKAIEGMRGLNMAWKEEIKKRYVGYSQDMAEMSANSER